MQFTEGIKNQNYQIIFVSFFFILAYNLKIQILQESMQNKVISNNLSTVSRIF